jgi:hypothetical protein
MCGQKVEFCNVKPVEWAGIAQSPWLLAIGWTIRGSNPCGGKIFRTRPDRPYGPLSLLYNGHQVIPRSKAAEAWL